MLDIPTLSAAVVLVMGLSSMSLLAHWLANRSIKGLGTLAKGMFINSFGICLLFFLGETSLNKWDVVGYICLFVGHMWYWLGIAEFWQARTSAVTFSTKLVTIIAAAGVSYLFFQQADRNIIVTFVAFCIFTFSLGCIYTVSKALGGSLGLYKGVVRRTSVGAGLAVTLFVLHGLYALYHAAVRGGVTPQLQMSGLLELPVLAQFEVLLFSMSFAMVVIIVTAERLQAELKIQEMLDPLTKALNRKAFIEVVKAVLARARRNAEPVSLIMMDIDQFKKINTQYGRTIGDQALALFAELVTAGRRAQDVFCRFDGEEFVFLLPGTPEEGADLVAKRIKEKIETSSLAPEGTPIRLSVSMGVVTERGDDLDADGMLDVVDRRMHRAQKLLFEKIQSA